MLSPKSTGRSRQLSAAITSLFRNRALLYLICIFAAFLGMEVWREWTGREGAIRRAHTEMANLATSLRQHAEDTFQMAEIMLAGVVQRFESEGLNPTSIARAKATMQTAITDGTRVRGLYVFDSAGNWVVNSLGVYPEGANNADRSYFEYHRTHADPSVHFTASVQSRSVGDAHVMVLSRRIDGPDGSFAGVASVTFDAKTFAEYYETFRVGQDGAITLLNRSGEIMSRMPFDENVLGTNIRSSPFFQNAAGQKADSFRFVSPVDNIERLGAYSVSERYPVMLAASKFASEATAEWLQGAIQRSIMVLCFLSLVAVLGFRLADQSRKRRAGEATLLAREAEFRMLAENSNDLVERFDADGTRQYASPAAFPLLGYRPDELVGHSAFDLIIPEDRPGAIDTTQRMRDGLSLRETVTCRLRRKDGRIIWVEAALQHVVDDTGRSFGVIVNTRDVTDRKEAELRLAAMATVDGLTGLQNRRGFDLALEAETARAQRTGTPVALLLLDVDRFKLYNDEYGHVAGDACLKAIAGVVAAAAERPGDVAARYGGEELVLLLPDTNSSAAAFIAGEICRQIQALAILHEHNAPWQVVTASIGVSSIERRRGEPPRDGAWLVSTADMALYQAKADGRNRARSAAPEVLDYQRDAG